MFLDSNPIQQLIRSQCSNSNSPGFTGSEFPVFPIFFPQKSHPLLPSTPQTGHISGAYQGPIPLLREVSWWNGASPGDFPWSFWQFFMWEVMWEVTKRKMRMPNYGGKMVFFLFNQLWKNLMVIFARDWRGIKDGIEGGPFTRVITGPCPEPHISVNRRVSLVGSTKFSQFSPRIWGFFRSNLMILM